MTDFLVLMRHVNRPLAPCGFIVETWNESMAQIQASDAYRAHFGPPARGGNWVACDFFFTDTRPIIRLRSVAELEQRAAEYARYLALLEDATGDR